MGKSIESVEKRDSFSFLDGFRGICALYVVAVHLIPRAASESEPNRLLGLIVKFFVQGHLAVSAFIMISGFCLILPVIKSDFCLPRGSLNFYWRRFLRIAPPFYCALLFAWVVGYLMGNNRNEYSIGNPWLTVFSYLTLLHFPLNRTLPNFGIAWSISVEWMIYIVFPLLLLLIRKIGWVKILLLIAVVAYSLIYFTEIDFVNRFVPQYYLLFLLGGAAAYISTKKLMQKIPWGVVSFVGCLIATCPFLILGNARAYTFIEYMDFPLGIGIMALLIYCVRTPNL